MNLKIALGAGLFAIVFAFVLILLGVPGGIAGVIGFFSVLLISTMFKNRKK